MSALGGRAPLDIAWPVAVALLLLVSVPVHLLPNAPAPAHPRASETATVTAANATGNLSASLNRLVVIASVAAGAVVTLAWIRVGISWFSNDPTKKVTAKDRARDAALGTFILLAAVTGLAWGLAHWVLTGS